MRLTILAAIAVLFLFPTVTQADDATEARLAAAVESLQAEVAALRAEVAELKATRCHCEPAPAPMPEPSAPVPVVRHPVGSPAPTRPMPDDGREWVWQVGSHGEYTWITYDPPGRVGAVPNQPQAASSYRFVPQPTYSPPPPTFAPTPVWGGGCANGQCYRR